MATWYAKTAGNWFAANAWNSDSLGTGTSATAPLPSGDTADLNGKAMTVADGQTITQSTILSTSTSGSLTCAGNVVINGELLHNASMTGMLVVPTGASVTHNGTITNNGGGSVVYVSGTGPYTLNSAGGADVMTANSGGRCVYVTGAASVTINGNGTANSNAVLIGTLGGAATITANGIYLLTANNNSGAIALASGTLTLNGSIHAGSSSGVCVTVTNAAATFIWTGSQVLGAYNCHLNLSAGTLNFSSLLLQNSGQLLIRRTTNGTLNFGAGETLAKIMNATETAQCVVHGASFAVTPYGGSGGGGSAGIFKGAFG